MALCGSLRRRGMFVRLARHEDVKAILAAPFDDQSLERLVGRCLADQATGDQTLRNVFCKDSRVVAVEDGHAGNVHTLAVFEHQTGWAVPYPRNVQAGESAVF